MLIEVGSPCSLPLGLIRTQDNRACLLGVTLQHPPTDVFAEASTQFSVTGPLAHKGYAYAQRFLAYHHLPQQANIEIELAIPDMLGLGAETMLSLSIARALAWVHGLPTDDAQALARAAGLGPQHALNVWGFQQGGLLLVDAQQLNTPLRRQPIAHTDQSAWGFVLLLPRVPPETPETLEADHLQRLLDAAPRVSAATERLLAEDLWPALEQDDLLAFARALMTLQPLNQQALTEAGMALPFTQDEQAVLDLFRDRGALAWGRGLTGMALYGLVKGASASVEIRHHLSELVGPYGGWVMATITDNVGARHTLHEMRPSG
jgi:beta-ribofuranosylaminobenzene 5'-phosphate synthase